VTKAELESKHLAELHTLAAEAGVERYRMLPRAELIEKLAGGGNGDGGQAEPRPKREGRREPSRRGGRGGRERGAREGGRERKPRQGQKPREGQPRQGQKPREERKPRAPREEPEERRPREERRPEPQSAPAAAAPASAGERPKRKRRRRRWGRRKKGVRVHDLLLPPAPGRRAILYAEDRAGCTALLRELAAELGGASNGPDPIALLIDPSPEELAEWKREAPAAEIVAASKAAHADDALAQAVRRAAGGEDVIVLIDSLTRFGTDFAGPDEARDLFDAGQDATGGTLTVVAALERPA
jgi:Rho termination factor-like protein